MGARKPPSGGVGSNQYASKGTPTRPALRSASANVAAAVHEVGDVFSIEQRIEGVAQVVSDRFVLVALPDELHPGRTIELLITAGDLQSAMRADRPFMELHAKPHWAVINPDVADIFGTTPYEKVDYSRGLFVADPSAFTPDIIDANAVLFDAHTQLFYRDADQPPVNRVYPSDIGLGVTAREFDLDKAEQLLTGHPWVVSLDHEEAHFYSDGSVPAQLHVAYKIPDDLHDQYFAPCRYHNDRTGAPIHPTPLSLNEAIFGAALVDPSTTSGRIRGLAKGIDALYDPFGLSAAARPRSQRDAEPDPIEPF